MGIDELRVLCLGNDIPDTRIRQKLQNNLKCPVVFEYVTADHDAHDVTCKKYDVILSNDGSTGLRALESASSAYPGTPFIFLLETIDEGRALELIEKGAADCVLADDSDRLSFVICKEIIKSKQTAFLYHTIEDLTEEIAAYRRLDYISSNYRKLKDLRFVYEDILEAAIAMTHADKGYLNIYVEKENCLKLITQRGFHESSIKLFEVISSGSFISGQVLANRRRCIAEDTDTAAYCSEAELQLIRDEQIRCFQSTPIISSAGIVYGMLNTHYCSKHSFNERELSVLDILAKNIADYIDKKSSEIALELSEMKASAFVQEMKTADRRNNEFLFKLSHELRNPLATIIAAISLLEISDEDSQIQNAHEIIKSEINQLRRLIDDLLEATRIANNKAYINKTLINLCQTVYESANSFILQFQKKSIQLVTEISDEPVIILADQVKIKQIIANLLSNAFSYTDEGGKVLLSLSMDKGCAILRVKDNGIGISPKDLPYLFNSFFQAKKPADRPNAGLGLGLAIVKGMAQLHGGTVSAYSQGLGCGSTFTVSLPIIDAPPADEE